MITGPSQNDGLLRPAADVPSSASDGLLATIITMEGFKAAIQEKHDQAFPPDSSTVPDYSNLLYDYNTIVSTYAAKVSTRSADTQPLTEVLTNVIKDCCEIIRQPKIELVTRQKFAAVAIQALAASAGLSDGFLSNRDTGGQQVLKLQLTLAAVPDMHPILSQIVDLWPPQGKDSEIPLVKRLVGLALVADQVSEGKSSWVEQLMLKALELARAMPDSGWNFGNRIIHNLGKTADRGLQIRRTLLAQSKIDAAMTVATAAASMSFQYQADYSKQAQKLASSVVSQVPNSADGFGNISDLAQPQVWKDRNLGLANLAHDLKETIVDGSLTADASLGRWQRTF